MSKRDSVTISEAAVAFTVRMRDYNSIAVQADLDGGTNVITFETSNDKVTWISAMGAVPSAALLAPVATLSANGLLMFPKSGEFFRARVSTYDDGDIVLSYTLSKAHVNAAKIPAS